MRTLKILGLIALLGSTSAFAGARDELGRFTRDLKGLDGQFSQTVFDAAGKQKEASSGRVAMSAPRLFRWEYVKPYPQLIVADGSKVWVFDPDLSQVTVRPQGAQEQDSPLAALIDPSRLDRDFVVVDAGTTGGLQWLALSPRQKGDSSFQSARLGFSATGLAKMQVIDGLGQRTEITFNGWKKNPAFIKGTFTYAPAKGVDVVGEG